MDDVATKIDQMNDRRFPRAIITATRAAQRKSERTLNHDSVAGFKLLKAKNWSFSEYKISKEDRLIMGTRGLDLKNEEHDVNKPQIWVIVQIMEHPKTDYTKRYVEAIVKANKEIRFEDLEADYMPEGWEYL